jgi:prevent-host-death family protein
MEMTWDLEEAKANFNKVIEASLSKGPQIITKGGKKTVVIISYAEYLRITKSSIPGTN